MDTSVILIDAENVLKSWRRYCIDKEIHAKIDYKKLVSLLSKNTNLLRAYFYDGIPEVASEKKRIFLQALQKQGIQLRTKSLKSRHYICESCKTRTIKLIQKGVDVSLATDILRHAFQKTCQLCIVVSGDEDYKDAVEVAKDQGIKIWVCSFKCALSSKLERSADKVILLDDMYEKIKQSAQ